MRWRHSRWRLARAGRGRPTPAPSCLRAPRVVCSCRGGLSLAWIDVEVAAGCAADRCDFEAQRDLDRSIVGRASQLDCASDALSFAVRVRAVDADHFRLWFGAAAAGERGADEEAEALVSG